MTSNNEYLFGKLNSETAKPNYSGVTTDSLVINVDNDNMTISGDVRWNSIIGEVAHKAYPGDKGARNYKLIQELTRKLTSEIEDALKHRKYSVAELERLSKLITQIESDLKTAINDSEIYTNETKKFVVDLINKETSRSTTIEKKLLDQINQEIGERKLSNSNCIKLLDSMQIKTLELEQLLQEKIDNEITRSKKTDEEYSKLLTEEIARAKKVELSLSESIAQFKNQNVDDILETIDTETRKREQVDATILQKIEDEIVRSKLFDDKVLTDIEDVKSIIDEIKSIELDLRHYISEHEKRLDDVEATAVNTKNDLIDEIALRNNQWIIFRDSLAAEEQRAVKAENNLHSRINDTNEVLIAIRDRLTDEINSRTAELQLNDEVILDSLYNEYNERVSNILRIDSEIESINNRFDNLANASEIVELRLSIESLDNQIKNIEDDISTIESNLKLLSDVVEKNNLDSVEKYNYLESLIEELDIGEGFVPILPTTESTVVFTQTGDSLESIEVTAEAKSDTVVKRDTNGNILLNESLEFIDKNNAVSKLYVDSIINEKTNELVERLEQMLTIDFIDGGNAPLQ